MDTSVGAPASGRFGAASALVVTAVAVALGLAFGWATDSQARNLGDHRSFVLPMAIVGGVVVAASSFKIGYRKVTTGRWPERWNRNR